MRWRIAPIVLLLAIGLATPAAADLATGTVTDPDDVTIALDIASASLTDENGTVTVTTTTYQGFADDTGSFYWLIQGRSDDSADAAVVVEFNQQTQQLEGFLLAEPGGSVTVSRPTQNSIRAVFARNALGSMGPLSFTAGAGQDVDADGSTDANEVDQAPNDFANAVFRIAGEDRIATAIDAWPETSTNAVVLARSDDYADALAGVPLAVANSAPILLTPPNALDPRVRDAINFRLDPGSRVFLLGGPRALSTAIEEELRASGFDVVRLFGADRYDTSVVIARDGLGSPSTVFLTRGDDFPDALPAGAAAGAVSGAVLLTDGSRVPPTVQQYLSEHPPAQRFAVGGSAAAADPSATPLVGADRYETSVRVAEQFFANAEGVAVASGERFPDALAAGAVTGSSDPPGPLLLTHPTSLTPVTRSYVEARADQLEVAVIFGGVAVMSEALVDQLETALL